MKTAYLAGPTVFLPDAVEMGAKKKAMCAGFGIEGLYPFDNEVDITAPDASKSIFLANVAMIQRADMVIADLTPYPFLVPSADAGTVWELGFAYALGKPCYGYSNDDRRFHVRQAAYFQDMPVCDATNVKLEDFGANVDNLMIHEALVDIVCRPLDQNDPYHDLGAFKTLLGKIIASQGNQ